MQEQERTIVALTGELDVYRAAFVRERFEAVPGAAVIDLSGVTYLDSTVLNELVRLRRRVGDDVTLVVRSPQIRRILLMTGFAEIFRIVEELDGPL